jgi:hypothetical protein
MKKGGMSLNSKIIVMIPIILTFIFSVNSLIKGIFRVDYLLRLVPDIFGMLTTYLLAGLMSLIVVILLFIRILKE